jgi:putative hydrolase of the HAD superfamily
MNYFHHKKHIFFDLDHTLWDFEKNSALAFETIFRNHQINLSLDDFLEHYVPTNLKYWKLFREEKISQVDLRYHRLKEVFDLMGENASDDLIHLLSHEYIQHLPNFGHLYDGAFEILDYLKMKNYQLHIITNGFADVQTKKLSTANISQFFKTVTDSDYAGVKKPNPIIFEKALHQAAAEVEYSVMIGDSWEADIEGAQNFGLDAIYFNENSQPLPEKSIITSVNHLLELKHHF